MLDRCRLTCLFPVLLALLSSQPATAYRIVPRQPDDWTLKTTHVVDFPAAIEVQDSTRFRDRVWVFRGDCPAYAVDKRLEYELELADFGLAPVPLKDAAIWRWSWKVENFTTADFVSIDLLTTSGAHIHLGATHAISEYGYLYYHELPATYQAAEMSIASGIEFTKSAYGLSAPAPDDSITSIVLTLRRPHRQEFWLGPISFGSAPSDSPGTPTPTPSETPMLLDRGSIVPIDLDGDGILELITPSRSGPKVLKYIDRMNAFGPDSRLGFLETSGELLEAVGGDLDGDGDTDLVVVEPNQSTFRILENRADGFYGDTLYVPTPGLTAHVNALLLTDDNHDSHLDLFVGYHSVFDQPADIWRFPGKPGPDFGPPEPLGALGRHLFGLQYMASADLNGDGNSDLLITSESIGLYAIPGRGDGTYGPAVPIDIFDRPGRPRALALCDVSGNGCPEIFLPIVVPLMDEVVEPWSRFYLNLGDFTFLECSDRMGMGALGDCQDACFVELNGLPGRELAVWEVNAGPVVFEFFEADSTLQARQIQLPVEGIPATATRLVAQDLNQDGRPELILGRRMEDPVIASLMPMYPVRMVKASERPENTSGIGRTYISHHSPAWALPVESTNRGGPRAIMVSLQDDVSLDGSGVPPVSSDRFPAGSVQTIYGYERTLRIRSRLLLTRVSRAWEHGFALIKLPWAGLALSMVLVAGAVLTTTTLLRRRRQLSSHNSRRHMLRFLGVASHTDWRTKLKGYRFVAEKLVNTSETSEEGPDLDQDISTLQSFLDPAFLDEINDTIQYAAAAGFKNTKRATAAVEALKHVAPGPRTMSRLLQEAEVLDAFLRRAQRDLSSYFLADLSDVANSVFLSLKHQYRWPGRFEIDLEQSLANAFPMHTRELRFVLEELIRNALKKRPLPTVIRVSASAVSDRKVQLMVYDDGPRIGAGTRIDEGGKGIDEVIRRLAAYRGAISLRNARNAGVEAVMTLPRGKDD